MGKKKLQRLRVEEILLPLYGQIEVYDTDTGELVGTFDYPPDEYSDWQKYEWNVTGVDRPRLDNVFPQLKQIIEGHDGKYESIELTWDQDRDGYCSLYRIAGFRDETDEEMNSRIAKEEQEVEEKRRKEQEKKEEARQRKLKMYEKLKQEFEP